MQIKCIFINLLMISPMKWLYLVWKNPLWEQSFYSSYLTWSQQVTKQSDFNPWTFWSISGDSDQFQFSVFQKPAWLFGSEVRILALLSIWCPGSPWQLQWLWSWLVWWLFQLPNSSRHKINLVPWKVGRPRYEWQCASGRTNRNAHSLLLISEEAWKISF